MNMQNVVQLRGSSMRVAAFNPIRQVIRMSLPWWTPQDGGENWLTRWFPGIAVSMIRVRNFWRPRVFRLLAELEG